MHYGAVGIMFVAFTFYRKKLYVLVIFLGLRIVFVIVAVADVEFSVAKLGTSQRGVRAGPS